MAMKARYTVLDGEIIAEKRDGVRRSYVPDALGSTVALIDSTKRKRIHSVTGPMEKSKAGLVPRQRLSNSGEHGGITRTSQAMRTFRRVIIPRPRAGGYARASVPQG